MSDKKKAPVVMGAPEWMVTFGDLMSLLLTFFVLLFSVSEIKDKKIYDLIRSFQNYFQIEAPSAGFHLENFDSVQNLLATLARELPDRSSGNEGRTERMIENPLGEDVGVCRVDDNLLIQIEGRIMFEEGSAEIREDGRKLIAELRNKLAGYPNLIRVVGHTSPLPLSSTSEYLDHFDLGYARAKAVRTILVADDASGPGIKPERVEVSSRGDQDALPGVDPFDRADRARLRRVEVIVTPYKARRSGSGERTGGVPWQK
ncbi:MAG: flagellar motor protein MotB [Planctomycetota bacterium]